MGAGVSVALALTGLAVTAQPAVSAVTDPDPEFRVNKADLEFILKQIQISESHAMGNPLLCESPSDTTWTCVPDPKLSYGLRTVDGSYNNLMPGQRKFGAAGDPFPRLAAPQFREADPGFGPPGSPNTSYAQKGANQVVVDTDPRLISNLIADQTVANPAAVEMMQTVPGSYSFDHDGDPATPDRVFIPNVSPDVGLSAPFTGWFTLFGQFFDHGLDLVAKGGSGVVLVPILPDDELYDPDGPDDIEGNADDGSNNFIPLTRATNLPGPDGILGNADDVQEHVNRTTPFIDQNQTYTSHPSHQAFVREYELVDGKPVPTGDLLNGDDADGDGERDGLATWDDVKEQARTVLGIELDDMDAVEVPLLVTDPYGRFVPGPDGFPQIVVSEDVQIEGDLAAPVDATEAMAAGVAFLDDIGHDAVPTTDGTHDVPMLGRHYITGDGRGNENIGLTAVHHVFHAEHNRVVKQVDELLSEIELTDPEFVTRWKATDGVWDYGERLFQAGRFVTEMEYQHLVFEEFVRTISPNIDAGPLNESLYHADIDAKISAEFAHVVYRFGHSMLTGDVDRQGYGSSSLSLFDAFLNPVAFTDDGAMTPDEGAAAVLMGMTKQTGNGIDEFVDSTLRNQLLGLPLDLAAMNIARARDTGSPSLQRIRQVLYNQTLDSALRPYANWADFRLALKNRASAVNFVAAYGNHPSITGATTVAGKRAAAEALMNDPASDFMTRPAAETGLNDVDFWIGGLAERSMDFGGMLGTTFNAVFETQMEHLQNGDRFYYLTRTAGMNLIQQLEGNSFAELALRNTAATGLNHNVFANPTRVFDLTDAATLDDGDPSTPDLTQVNGRWLYDGEDHVVIHGSAGDDRISGGIGDDSVWGHDGADELEGGQGNDILIGQHGDDILTDIFGDDVVHGGDGSDAINAGAGLDLIFGGAGRDLILHGQDPTQDFAGDGDDLIRGGDAGDVMTGNEGGDWMEGGDGADLVQGDNALTFQNDPNGGPDVLMGQRGNDDHDAEGGDDIMLNNGTDRHGGMLGFDWVTHKADPLAANADLGITVFIPPNVQVLRSRFLNVEGLSGWDRNDVLRGSSVPGDPLQRENTGHELTQAHLDRIVGLRALLGGGAVPKYATPFMSSSQANNIILGGAGSDVLEGRGGEDFIDGDAALDVHLAVGGQTFDSITDVMGDVFSGVLSPNDIEIVREVVGQETDPTVVDSVVYADVLDSYRLTENGDGTWQVTHRTPGAAGDTGVDILRNVERVVFADQTIDLVDIANTVVSGAIEFSTLSPVEDQELTATPALTDPDGIDAATMQFEWQWADNQGVWTASVNGTGAAFTPGDVEAGRPLRVVVTYTDGAGVLESFTSVATAPVENVNDAPTGLVTDTDAPMTGSLLTATGLVDDDGLGDPVDTFVHQWQSSSNGTAWSNISGTKSPTFTPTFAQLGKQVRVRIRYTDLQGTTETVFSPATQPVGTTATPPSAPTIGAVTAGDGQVEVQWTAPGDNGGAPLSGYNVEVQDAAGVPVGGMRVAGPGATSLVVDGLTNGTEYRFRVQAVNPVGPSEFSQLSAAATPEAPVVAPTVVGSSPENNQTDFTPGGFLTVDFSEPVTGTLGGNVVLMRVADSVSVPYTRHFDSATSRLTLNPYGNSAEMLQAGDYELMLKGGASGIRNAAGVPIADTTISFAVPAVAAPSVVSSDPADAATGVRPGTFLRVDFSETVTGTAGSNVVLTRVADGAEIPYTRYFDTAANRLTVNPYGGAADVLAAGDYTLTLRGGPWGIRSLTGVPIEETTLSFTVEGVTAPTVVASDPSDGGTHAPGAHLRVDFSETVTGTAGSNVVLTRVVDGVEIPYTRYFDTTANRLTVNPYGAGPEVLAAGEYVLTLKGGKWGIRNLSGVPIAESTISFTVN